MGALSFVKPETPLKLWDFVSIIFWANWVLLQRCDRWIRSQVIE